jgi:dihydropteroate synthase
VVAVLRGFLFVGYTETLCQNATNRPMTAAAEERTNLDNELSNRFIDLDPQGYFIIYIDQDQSLICAKHFTNTINEQGLATDPETGEVLACKGSLKRTHTKIYTGRTAKELGIKITEEADPCPVSRLDHAMYLGREFVKAEMALFNGTEYIQD